MMKKKVLILLAIGLMLGVSTVQAELIANGSYETEDADWSNPFSVYRYADQIYFEGPAPADAGLLYGWAWNETTMGSTDQVLDVSSYVGNTYRFQAWLSSYTSDGDYAEVRLQFYDAAGGAGNPVGDEILFDGNDGNSAYIIGSADSAGEADSSVAWTQDNWTFYQVYGSIPASAVSAVVTITSNSAGGNGNDAYVDLVSFEEDFDITDWPHTPTPSDGAFNVPAATPGTLSWHKANGDDGNDPNFLGYTVYFGEVGNMGVVGDTDTSPIKTTDVIDSVSHDPNTIIEINKSYEWRVDTSYSADGSSTVDFVKTGFTWTFDAVKTFPNIIAGPEDIQKAPGDSAAFTVTLSNPETVTGYQWIYDPDPNTVGAGVSGNEVILPGGDAAVTGALTDTLTIDPVAVAHEGYYWVEVTGAAGTRSSRDPDGDGLVDNPGALLRVERCVASLSFNNDYTNSVGNDGVLDQGYTQADPLIENSSVADPSFVVPDAGGNAVLETTLGSHSIEFYGIENDPGTDVHVAVDVGGIPLEDITLSAWVKPDFAGGTDNMIVIEGDRSSNDNPLLDVNAGGAFTRLWGAGATIQSPQGSVQDGVWTFIAVSSGAEGTTLYVNGEPMATTTGSISAFKTAFQIGGDNIPDGDDAFRGQIDEVEICNYAKTTDEIAQDYLDDSGLYACIDRASQATWDFNNDCQVDFADFADFAAHWLDEGFYPEP